MFEGFKSQTIDVGETHIVTHSGGNPDGQPLLLLQGFPETHVMWHKVAPQLVQDGFFVICASFEVTARVASHPLRATIRPTRSGRWHGTWSRSCRSLVTSASLLQVTTEVGASPIVWRLTTPSVSPGSGC